MNAPVGGLWRFLEIDFSPSGSLGFFEFIHFRADTDSIATPGDIEPFTRVPEPSTTLIVAAGLVLVGIGPALRVLGRTRPVAGERWTEPVA